MIRTYEAGVSVVIIIVVLSQIITFSLGSLGEQWESTSLDVEVKRALEEFQFTDASASLEKYSKIRDPDLLRVPDAEAVGYRLLVNSEPVDRTVPPEGVEIASTDARIYYMSRDAARIVPTFRSRLLRSDYVNLAGRTLDYESVDELAGIVLGIIWDDESHEMLEERVGILIGNQNDDGGWGFVGGEDSNTLCTATAVRALSAWIRVNDDDPLSSPVIVAGVGWLRSGVHADGGYGAREMLESSVDMTAHVILAYVGAGLASDDPWVASATDYLLRAQRPDGGFPLSPRGESQSTATALALEALMVLSIPGSFIEQACAYLESSMIDDGEVTFTLDPRGGAGTYDLSVDTGYMVDSSPRGYEFWGNHLSDPIIAIVDVYGTRENMTVELRIDRTRLELPENKQKIALAFSHNSTPDDTDWWILNAGNPHTAGQGDPIDDPKFDRWMVGIYTHVVITDLVVPDEYEFFAESEDWLIAVVGDSVNTVQDNVGRGYNIGFWDPWMSIFDFNNILAWSSLGSPRINRVCLDLDQDGEFDDIRLTDGDSVIVRGRDWVLGIWENETAVNLSFSQADLNITRYYYPSKYDISGIPESISGLYHLGMVSITNKVSFDRDYRIVLRDSEEAGVYDEAYVWDGCAWICYPDGSLWDDGTTVWVVDIEGDFVVLTRQSGTSFSALSGPSTQSIMVEGDFLVASVTLNGPSEVSLIAHYGEVEAGRTIFDESSFPLRICLASWGGLRETSTVYHALALAEAHLSGSAAASAHNAADLCQQTIKFEKLFNSVIEDRLDVQAWYRHLSDEL